MCKVMLTLRIMEKVTNKKMLPTIEQNADSSGLLSPKTSAASTLQTDRGGQPSMMALLSAGEFTLRGEAQVLRLCFMVH